MFSSITLPHVYFLLTGISFVLLCYLVYLKYIAAQYLPFPPGPRPLPFLGNVMDLPKGKAWETYSPIIILNSSEAVYELLEHRAAIYSDRPHFTMFTDMMDFGASTTFQQYGDIWRKHRTLYHKQLNSVAVRRFYPQLVMASTRLLHSLLKSPERYSHHLRHYSTGIVMDIAYGYEVSTENDRFVVLAERNLHILSRTLRPGAYLVDVFPILKYVPSWFPGAEFKRIAQETRRNVQEARDAPFQAAKEQLGKGVARPSLVSNALTELDSYDDSSEDVLNIKRVAGSVFAAGSDTTTSTVHSFLLAMILNPDVQRKAQTEIDSCTEGFRLPEFSDRPALPYINAIVKELFRWFPVAPTGLPHVSTKEDIYKGYRIPAGSIVIPNSRSILHDPQLYPEPHLFRPERFLEGSDGRTSNDPASNGAFGYGRRICPGRNLGDASVWIAVASILSVFDISKAVGECGMQIDVSFALDPLPGVVSHPQPFYCSIKPRSPQKAALILGRER
ncbi:cytochrome P450 [Hysterangium stoloniferum]|nr:cytochrome P450 [Hysterangium stoloniferum]